MRNPRPFDGGVFRLRKNWWGQSTFALKRSPTPTAFAEIVGDNFPTKANLSPIALNSQSWTATRDKRAKQRHERHTVTEQRERRKQLTNLCGDVLASTAGWNLGHAVDVAILATCSEQPLDRQPAYHLGLDAFHEVRVGLGVIAHFLVALARHPDEAIAIEFDAIRVPVEIAFGRFAGRRLASAGQLKSTPISVFSLLERGSRL